MPETPDTWTGFAFPTSRGGWMNVCRDERTARYYRLDDPPVPVTIEADPEGEYLGWLNTGETEPTMIQYGRIFNIQFPYGYKAEEEAGRGRAIRLTIRETVDPLTPPA